jgi:uncharacterized membrane protein YdbT with pleckstrin-like domain
MNEKNVYQCRLHWIIFLRPLFLLLIPALVTYLGLYSLEAWLAFILIVAVWLLSEMVKYMFTVVTIKPNNVIIQSGFLIQQTLDFPMRRIESIDIRQTIIGAIFNYGDIVITGSGGTQEVVAAIEHPLTCRRYIEQNLHRDGSTE